MEGVEVEVYDKGAYREALLLDIFEDEVVVRFENEEKLMTTVDMNLVRLPPSGTSKESVFTVGQDVEVYIRINEKTPLGWWHALVKKNILSNVEVDILNGGNCTINCPKDLLRPKNTNPPVNSKTVVKFEIDVPEEAREAAVAVDAHKEFRMAIKAGICQYDPERGVLIIITSFKKTKKLVNTLKTMHFNNLALKKNEQKNEQERPTMAEGTQRQISAEFLEACLSLEEILKCPICLEYLEPPLAQCVRGHGVCSTCKNQLTDCPLCREQFIDFNASVLSQVVKVLPRTCKYRLEGCTEIVRTRDTHRDYCGYRPTKCLLCYKSVAVNSLLNHYHTTHSQINSPNQDISSDIMNFPTTENAVYFNLFYQFNHFFWRKVTVDVENKIFSITIVRIPTEEFQVAIRYFAKIKLKKGVSKYSSCTVIPFVLKELDMDNVAANIVIPLEAMADVMRSFLNSTNEVLAFDLNITGIN